MSAVVGKLSVDIDVNDAALQAGLNKATNAAQQAGQKMQQSMSQGADKAAGSAANMGRAILNASRGIQDFQAAGLNGIINNVEGIASAFGVGAGVAGAVTLAAVAIQSLSPAIQSAIKETSKLLGLWESESERASRSVEFHMGAGGAQAVRIKLLQEEIELLKERNGFGDSSFFSMSRIGDAATLLKDTATSGFKDMRSLEERNSDLQLRRAAESAAKLQESFRLAADAARDLAAAQRSASAKYDLTTNQKGETQINQQLFQAAVDKYGGGENLRTKIEQAGIQNGMKKTDADELYGKFATGDIAATKAVESMVNLTAERTRLMAEDFERATGSAEELKRIENDKAQEAKAELQRQIDDIYEGIVEAADAQTKRVKEANRSAADEIGQMTRDELERQSLQKQAGNVRERIEDLMSQRARSEVVGMSSVFEKNLNAGMEDPVVKAIEKQTEELKQINRELATLG